MLPTISADTEKMKLFWSWFEENENWIIDTYRTNGMAVVDAVDFNLKPAFTCYGIELEFELGFNNGKGEFFFFDLDNPSLNRDAQKLGELMPDTIKYRWSFIIEH